MPIFRTRLRGRGLADTAAEKENAAATSYSAPAAATSITGNTLTVTGAAPINQTVNLGSESNAYRRWAAIRAASALPFPTSLVPVSAPVDKATAFRLARARVTRLGAAGTAVATKAGQAVVIRAWWRAVDPNGQACWDRGIVPAAPQLATPTSVAGLLPRRMVQAVTSAEAARALKADAVNWLVGLTDQAPPATLKAVQSGSFQTISTPQPIPLPVMKTVTIPKDDRPVIPTPQYDPVNENTALATEEVLTDPGAPPEPEEPQADWTALLDQAQAEAQAEAQSAGFPWLLAGAAALGLILLTRR